MVRPSSTTESSPEKSPTAPTGGQSNCLLTHELCGPRTSAVWGISRRPKVSGALAPFLRRRQTSRPRDSGSLPWSTCSTRARQAIRNSLVNSILNSSSGRGADLPATHGFRSERHPATPGFGRSARPRLSVRNPPVSLQALLNGQARATAQPRRQEAGHGRRPGGPALLH